MKVAMKHTVGVDRLCCKGTEPGPGGSKVSSAELWCREGAGVESSVSIGVRVRPLCFGKKRRESSQNHRPADLKRAREQIF